MVTYVMYTRRKELGEAGKFWRDIKASTMCIAGTRPFCMVGRDCVASQASSAPAERLFSDLGKLDNNQVQSTLSYTLEITELIRILCRMSSERFFLHNMTLNTLKWSSLRV